LSTASQWELAIKERIKNLREVSESSQQRVNSAWDAYRAREQQTGLLEENMQFVSNAVNPWSDRSGWVWPGVYENENRPTINESRERIQAVEAQVRGLNENISRAESELEKIVASERAFFAGMVKNQYSRVRGLPDGAIVGEPGDAKGQLEASYNETTPILDYASAMNADAVVLKAQQAQVSSSTSAMASPSTVNLDAKVPPKSLSGGSGGGSGGGGGGGGSPAPRAAAPTTAAPSPTPSFQKKSSMSGWVVPVAALAVGGGVGYMIGKSNKKSSNKKSSSSSSSDDSESRNVASSSGSRTSESRNVASSSGSTKKSWKGLPCPEASNTESLNPTVQNTNNAMNNLRSQCLQDGGLP
jgi:hypothetical protein